MAFFFSDGDKNGGPCAVLNRVELDALANFAFEEVQTQVVGRTQRDEMRLAIAAGRFLENSLKGDPDAHFSIDVTGEIRWFIDEVFVPLVDEYDLPFVATDREEYCRNSRVPYEEMGKFFDQQLETAQARIAVADAFHKAVA